MQNNKSTKCRWRAESEVAEAMLSEITPMLCVVYSCSNHSNQEMKMGVPLYTKVRNVEHSKKWILNLRLQSGKAESANTGVCSDHSVRGRLVSLLEFCGCVYKTLSCHKKLIT